MPLEIDALVSKAVTLTQTAGQAKIIPQVWAAQLEDNLRRAAVYEQSMVENTDLLGTSGDKVYLPTLPDVAAAVALTEGTDMDVIALTDSTSVALTPAEVGRAVGITRKALDRIKYDGMSAIVDRLAYAMTLYMQNTCAGLWNVVVPGTATKFTQKYPNGHATGTIVAGDVLTSKIILNNVAALEQADVYPFSDGFFRMYISPKQYADLLQDADVRNDLRYASPQVMLHGEVGVLHNVRLIKTNFIGTGAEGSGGLVPTFKSLLVAPRWAAIAWKRRPEIVVDPTVYDFGRSRRFGITADLDIQPIHADRALVVVTA